MAHNLATRKGFGTLRISLPDSEAEKARPWPERVKVGEYTAKSPNGPVTVSSRQGRMYGELVREAASGCLRMARNHPLYRDAVALNIELYNLAHEIQFSSNAGFMMTRINPKTKKALSVEEFFGQIKAKVERFEDRL